MLKGLNHITIAVSDVARSFDFYVNTLGFYLRPDGPVELTFVWEICGYVFLLMQ